MKKRLIIISVIVIVVSLAVILYMLNKKNAMQKNAPQNISEKKFSTEIPLLPGRDYIDVEQNNIKDAVEKQIENEKTKKNTFTAIGLKTKNNQPVQLNDFKKAENIQINDEVYKNISQSNFQVFLCCATGNECKKGLIFSVERAGSGGALIERYKKIGEGLQSWEKNILQDLKDYFFQKSQIDTTAASQFKSTKFITENGANKIEIRFANVKDKEGKNISIDYAFFDNQIYVSNDWACIKSALNKYQDVLEP